MTHTSTTVVVPYPDGTIAFGEPRITALKGDQLRALANGPRIAVLLDDGNNIIDIKYNQVPEHALKAAAPSIEHALINSNIQKKTAVAVPAYDVWSLQQLLSLLRDTVVSGRQMSIKIDKATPLWSFSRIGETAHALGMTHIEQNVLSRSNGILNADLHQTRVYITAADVRAIYGNFDATEDLRKAVASAIGRGIVAKRIGNSKELMQVEEEIPAFKKELKAMKSQWGRKKKAGEDILSPA